MKIKIKSILSNSAGILFSRITGLFRDVLMASILGISIFSDIFFIAFKIPSLFRRIFGEGAFVQTFMPAFISSNNKSVFSVAIFIRFNIFLIISSILVSIFPEVLTKLIAWSWSDENIKLASPFVAINFWYLTLIFIVTFIATLLQYKEHFATTSFSTSLLNISMICAMWIYSKDEPIIIIYALSIAVLIGGFLQIISHLIALKMFKLYRIFIGGWKYRKIKNINLEKKKFIKNFIPSIWGNSTAQISSFIDTLLASFLAIGSISHLFYANRLFQFPLAVITIATTIVIFPAIGKAVKSNNIDLAYENIKKAFIFLIPILSFSVFIGIFMAEEIVKLIFERGNFGEEETKTTANILKMYMIGLIPFSIAKLFSLFLYASQKHILVAKFSTISLIINICISIILMNYIGSMGIALASSLTSFVLLFLVVKELDLKKLFNK